MSKGNDQVVPAIPGTNVGGHDTSGADGEKRTERSGELLGTPDVDETKHTADHRKQAIDQADFVAQEVDRANREDLPRLGGELELADWKAEKGGSPEFLDAQVKTTERSKPKGSVTTADVPQAPRPTVHVSTVPHR